MKLAQFSSISGFSRIDAEAGIIYGVSVITEGEAQGANAGTWIDKTTLSQIHAVASKFPDGVKVKLSQSKEHDGSAGQIVGILKNFRTDGSQERADLHLLKASESRALILEMAATMPNEFGLSVVIPKECEKVDGRNCLRCSDIYSIDLVESPAANKGLFSKKDEEVEMSEDGKTHKDSCMCKTCMSKKKNTSMSKIIAMSLGLAETATEQEIADALKTALTANKPTDLTALTAKNTELETKLSKLESASLNAVALSKKAEIDNLMAEAGRNGQVVPLEAAELYEVKDGVCTVHMEPTQLSKIIGRIPKGGISLSKHRPTVTAPKDDKGNTFDRHTPEGREMLREWCLSKQRENAPEIARLSREANKN